MLELCYHTFYHPHNMMLFVVGNIQPEELMNVIKENQNKKHFLPETSIQRKKIEEPESVAVKEQIDIMQVEMNKLIVSIKVNDIMTNPQEKIKRELSFNLLFDLYFSKSSVLYNEWLSKGYINDLVIEQEDFERIKRKTIGNFINSYNSPESIANSFSRYYFEGICSFELVDYVSKITIADLNEVKKYFNKEYASTYIVKKDK